MAEHRRGSIVIQYQILVYPVTNKEIQSTYRIQNRKACPINHHHKKPREQPGIPVVNLKLNSRVHVLVIILRQRFGLRPVRAEATITPPLQIAAGGERQGRSVRRHKHNQHGNDDLVADFLKKLRLCIVLPVQNTHARTVKFHIDYEQNEADVDDIQGSHLINRRCFLLRDRMPSFPGRKYA